MKVRKLKRNHKWAKYHTTLKTLFKRQIKLIGLVAQIGAEIFKKLNLNCFFFQKHTI